jgi:hypothetical protein
MALEENGEPDLVSHVVEAFRAGSAMTRKELLKTVRERSDTALMPGWVNVFIGSHFDALKTGWSLPQEDTRLTVPRVRLEGHI